MPTAVRSHAKINLGLFLGPLRPDGFHALATVYQTLEIHDVVTVTAIILPLLVNIHDSTTAIDVLTVIYSQPLWVKTPGVSTGYSKPAGFHTVYAKQ